MSSNLQRTFFENADVAPSSAGNAVSLLALSKISGVGFATIKSLFEAYHGDLIKVWTAGRDDLYEHLRLARIPQPTEIARQITSNPKPLVDAAREQYRFLKARRKTHILFRDTPEYPIGLYSLNDPPTWLFVEGDTKALTESMIVAVVGTRNPTDQGLEATKRLSVTLSRAGCVILSGLAEGIDAAAHQTAVDYGAPTIAVLGHGVDVVFPASTSGLRREIVDSGGAVISEYLPGDTYNRTRFVQRNRIQAALSRIVTVVEGKSKSGTAHTLRFARQMNRDLFGVRLGQEAHTPQQELHGELLRYGFPIFDLDNQDGREGLRIYLHNLFPQLADGKKPSSPRLFRGLLSEISRVARHYDATAEDFDWLTEQINRLRPQETLDNADQGTSN
jgi:DNA processing protein